MYDHRTLLQLNALTSYYLSILYPFPIQGRSPTAFRGLQRGNRRTAATLSRNSFFTQPGLFRSGSCANTHDPHWVRRRQIVFFRYAVTA